MIFEDGDKDLNLGSDGKYVIFNNSIEELYLGRNLNYFAKSPFYLNTKFKTISLGKYVNLASSINPQKNEDLEVINCYTDIPPIMYDFTNVQFTKIIVNIPKGTLSVYQADPTWGNFWNLQETLPAPVDIENITLNVESVELDIEKTVQLNAIITPDEDGYNGIIWISSNEDIATVDETGLVTAILPGQCVITATSEFDPSVYAECKITVKEPIIIESITLNLESVELKPEETVQLTATITPNEEGYNGIVWSSSDYKIATVSETGLVTAVSPGECEIQATSKFDNSKYAECKIKVKNSIINSEQITLNKESVDLKINETCQLEATVLPEETTDKTIKWESSNPEVATVNETGLVKAVSEGKSTITASNGEVSAKCEITVLRLMGDSNRDGVVDIIDAAYTAFYIRVDGIGINSFDFKSADINNDGNITISDVTATISIILDQENTRAYDSYISDTRSDTSDYLTISDTDYKLDETINIPVHLFGTHEYSALQADIISDFDITINDVKLGEKIANTHNLSLKRFDNNHYRIVIFDIGNNEIPISDDPILYINITPENKIKGSVNIQNIIAADSEARGYSLSFKGGNIKTTSAVSSVGSSSVNIEVSNNYIIVHNASGENISIYGIDGKLVMNSIAKSNCETCNVGSGLYIVNVGNKTEKVLIR